MKIASTEIENPLTYNCEFVEYIEDGRIIARIDTPIYGGVFGRLKDISLLVLKSRYAGDELRMQGTKLPIIVNVFLPIGDNDIRNGPWEHVDIAEISE
jgi:hypothetical protein